MSRAVERVPATGIVSKKQMEQTVENVQDVDDAANSRLKPALKKTNTTVGAGAGIGQPKGLGRGQANMDKR